MNIDQKYERITYRSIKIILTAKRVQKTTTFLVFTWVRLKKQTQKEGETKHRKHKAVKKMEPHKRLSKEKLRVCHRDKQQRRVLVQKSEEETTTQTQTRSIVATREKHVMTTVGSHLRGTPADDAESNVCHSSVTSPSSRHDAKYAYLSETTQ